MANIPAWSSKPNSVGSSLLNTTRINAGVTGANAFAGARAFSSSARALQTPDFGAYRAKSPEAHRAFSYFLIGTFGAVATASARSTVTNFLSTMSASSDVLALAKVEVDLSNIPLGKNAIIKWRGKPVFVRHRTQQEIDEANSVDVSTLRDPQTDSERAERPEWLVMLGVCTHLGCVPIGEAGDYDGWFCPCHGSHYDISGRIRKGPGTFFLSNAAPLNLEVPVYKFNDEEQKVCLPLLTPAYCRLNSPAIGVMPEPALTNSRPMGSCGLCCI